MDNFSNTDKRQTCKNKKKCPSDCKDKVGNSNTSEQINFLEKFNKIFVFGFDRIKSLMADREFMVQDAKIS